MSYLNYKVVCADGKSGKVTRKLKADTEYLVAYYYSTVNGGPDIVIGGNGLGLRKLAQMLIELADVDQSVLEIPDNALDHIHVHTGVNSEAYDRLPRLTIFRADTKSDASKLNSSFPAHVPRLGKKAIR